MPSREDKPGYWLGASVELESYWASPTGCKVGTIIGTNVRNGLLLFTIEYDDSDGSNPYSGVTVPRSQFWLAW